MRNREATDDTYKVNQLDAMHFCEAAWNLVTPQTVTNCFQHTILMKGKTASAAINEDQEAEVDSTLESIRQTVNAESEGMMEEIEAAIYDLAVDEESIQMREDLALEDDKDFSILEETNEDNEVEDENTTSIDELLLGLKMTIANIIPRTEVQERFLIDAVKMMKQVESEKIAQKTTQSKVVDYFLPSSSYN